MYFPLGKKKKEKWTKKVVDTMSCKILDSETEIC